MTDSQPRKRYSKIGHVTPRRRPKGKCLFCGNENLSHEHVIARWLREELKIQRPVEEHLEFGAPRTWDTLAVVLPEVCEGCNTGWLSWTEKRANPILRPMLFGDRDLRLNAMQQAKLARWAVKTSLLIALKKSKGKLNGWVPRESMYWLYRNPESDQPPPGSYVWIGCLNTQGQILSYMQSGALLNDTREPIGHVGVFSVGCILFQVFCTEPDAVEYSEERDGNFVPSGMEAGLVSIRPSKKIVQWPSTPRFTGESLRILAERNRQGPGALFNGPAARPPYQSWPIR
jgi:hypothetical protein